MPQETIDDKITRLETDLARVRDAISRSEANGSQFAIQGTTISQVAYEKLLERERVIERDLRDLYARKKGKVNAPAVAVIESKAQN